MRLICYHWSGACPKITTAPVDRSWMNQTTNRFAYRCLPLNIANAHGWLILNTVPFTAIWNGESDIGAVSVQPCSVGSPLLARSHFGSGVLTFKVNGLFQTEPGFDLMVTGPLNEPKDGIQPLTGIVETDWSPFSFTMNWKFTRNLTSVSFEQDEPYCMIYPLARGTIEEVDPEIRLMDENKVVQEQFNAFSLSRARFQEDLRVPGSEARIQGWQRDYFRGTGRIAAAPASHRTKLKLRDFKRIS
jgi:hypothetical protein